MVFIQNKLQGNPRFNGKHTCNLCCVFVSLSGNSRNRNRSLIKYPVITNMAKRQQLTQQVNVAKRSDI